MKKVFLLASATLLLASCSDDLGKDFTFDSIEGKSVITATYALESQEGESRTMLEGGIYVWTPGDALGVFNAPTGDATTFSDYTNATFKFTGTSNSAAGTFSGDTLLLAGNGYVGYYPYDPNAVIENGSLSIAIKSHQNYNYSSENTPNNSAGTLTGSFSQNTAPAVAYGTTITEGNLDLTFSPLVGFLVVKVTGYSEQKITSVKLQVKDNAQQGTTTYKPLAGTLNVNVADIIAGNYEKDAENQVIPTLADDSDDAITLNLGRGIELTSEVTNLWFVVPADLDLKNTTISLLVNSDSEVYPTMERTFAADWTGFSADNSTTIGLNKVRWINGENNKPFNYNPSNTFFIETEQQFLEYAYLATNWTTAIEQYQNIKQYYTDNNVGEDEANEIISNYSDFEYMVDNATAPTQLNPAVISQNLTFDPDAIMAWLTDEETNNTAAPNSRGGIIVTPPAIQPDPVIAPYFENAYYNYAKDGFINTIGGEMNATISGKTGENITLSGLTVSGNGMFQGNATYTTNVNDITLEDITVINKNGYFLSFTYRQYAFYTGLTIGKNCTVSDGSETSATITGSNGAVYGRANSTFYPQFKGAVNLDGVDMLFANDLLIFSDVNFTTGYDIDAFGTISIYEAGHVLEVGTEAKAIGLITGDQVVNPVTGNTVLGYSVVAEGTSYWTGTAYSTNDYAEGLAYVVQTVAPEHDTSFSGKYNLNLMGKNWWNKNTKNTITMIVTNPEGITISGVDIDGTSNGTSAVTGMVDYSLLGYSSKVTGILTISDITIAPTESNDNTNNSIAAISTVPAAETNATITVAKMTVSASKAANESTCGGLYATLNSTTAPYVGEDSELTFNGKPSLDYGWVAGLMNYTVSLAEGGNVIDGYGFKSGAFGAVAVTVDGENAGDNNVLFIEFEDAAFSIPEIVNGEAPSTVKVGDNTIGNLTLSTKNLNNVFTVYVPANGTWYYQFTYNPTNEKIGFSGVYNLPKTTVKSMMKR